MTLSSTPTPRPAVRAAGVVALLALYYVMALTAAGQKSMTFDEMAHLTGGYTYWAFDDYRLHPENGNWPQRLGALPAVLSGARFPALNQPAWTTSNLYVIGDQYLYFSGNDADTLLSRARAVMTLVGVALGALVYAWSRRLVSPEAGWLSLGLFVFSPMFLAHGPLVTSDMTAALFFTAAAGAIWVVMHRVTPPRVLGAAVLVAGCALSKLSGPILAPVALIMLVARVIDGRPLPIAFRGAAVEYGSRARQVVVLLGVLLVFALVAWALVWASYGFRYTAFSAATTGKDAFLGQVQDQPGIVGRVLSTARQHHLLPEAYIYASLLTVQFANERAAFLNGQFATTGWWWYFPYAFSVKTTIAAMLIGVLALAALVVRWKDGREGGTGWTRARAGLYAGTPLLALVGIYGVFALASNLNIGHRHLLPIYPALCILAGGAAFWIRPLFSRAQSDPPQTGRGRRARKVQAVVAGPSFSSARRALGVATLALLAWHVAESISVRPSYLAYFNQLAGGPSQGYLHLADSSLDWGQDLPALKQWLDGERLQRGDGNVYLSYFGTARPEYYGIQATPLAGFIDRRQPSPPVPLGGGVYCVSATMLDVVSRLFYKPEYETNYQAAAKNAAIFARASQDEQSMSSLMRDTGEEYWRQLFGDFDQLRTGRLLAFLRQRRPDAMVGYSILIYRLTDADVAQALNDPLSASR
jgi:4-amino-4-deoxy-L-arabinose transferase-like glycosyltransferase